jgi:hypothetical protein
LSESQPQKPPSTRGFSKFRKILTIKPEDKSSMNALADLHVPKRDKLGFPGWEKK